MLLLTLHCSFAVALLKLRSRPSHSASYQHSPDTPHSRTRRALISPARYSALRVTIPAPPAFRATATGPHRRLLESRPEALAAGRSRLALGSAELAVNRLLFFSLFFFFSTPPLCATNSAFVQHLRIYVQTCATHRRDGVSALFPGLWLQTGIAVALVTIGQRRCWRTHSYFETAGRPTQVMSVSCLHRRQVP